MGRRIDVVKDLTQTQKPGRKALQRGDPACAAVNEKEVRIRRVSMICSETDDQRSERCRHETDVRTSQYILDHIIIHLDHLCLALSTLLNNSHNTHQGSPRFIWP